MAMNNNTGFFFLGIFVALGLAACGYFASQTLYNAKVAVNTAEAKGLAERRVQSDQASWRIGLSVAGTTQNQVSGLYKAIEEDQKQVIDILKQQGFSDEEIQTGIINLSYREYRDENQKLIDERHTLSGSITIETDKVDLISKARIAVNKLVAEGVNIDNGTPAYRFTKLNDIKPDMLREATQNARIAANEFAQNAGITVGSIRSARQGGFIVRDAGEDYGDTAKIEKDVRVVTTINFYLTD